MATNDEMSFLESTPTGSTVDHDKSMDALETTPTPNNNNNNNEDTKTQKLVNSDKLEIDHPSLYVQRDIDETDAATQNVETVVADDEVEIEKKHRRRRRKRNAKRLNEWRNKIQNPENETENVSPIDTFTENLIQNENEVIPPTKKQKTDEETKPRVEDEKVRSHSTEIISENILVGTEPTKNQLNLNNNLNNNNNKNTQNRNNSDTNKEKKNNHNHQNTQKTHNTRNTTQHPNQHTFQRVRRVGGRLRTRQQ